MFWGEHPANGKSYNNHWVWHKKARPAPSPAEPTADLFSPSASVRSGFPRAAASAWGMNFDSAAFETRPSNPSNRPRGLIAHRKESRFRRALSPRRDKGTGITLCIGMPLLEDMSSQCEGNCCWCCSRGQFGAVIAPCSTAPICMLALSPRRARICDVAPALGVASPRAQCRQLLTENCAC